MATSHEIAHVGPHGSVLITWLRRGAAAVGRIQTKVLLVTVYLLVVLPMGIISRLLRRSGDRGISRSVSSWQPRGVQSSMERPF